MPNWQLRVKIFFFFSVFGDEDMKCVFYKQTIYMIAYNTEIALERHC